MMHVSLDVNKAGKTRIKQKGPWRGEENKQRLQETTASCSTACRYLWGLFQAAEGKKKCICLFDT